MTIITKIFNGDEVREYYENRFYDCMHNSSPLNPLGDIVIDTNLEYILVSKYASNVSEKIYVNDKSRKKVDEELLNLIKKYFSDIEPLTKDGSSFDSIVEEQLPDLSSSEGESDAELLRWCIEYVVVKWNG